MRLLAAIGGSHCAATVTSPLALCVAGRRWALFPFGQGDDLLGNLAGGMGLGQQVDMLGQALQAAVVADGLQGGVEQGVAGFGVAHADGGLLAHQGHGVLGLVVFGHVGRGHEDDGLAQQAKLRDAAGAGARDDQVGRGIGRGHVADEGRGLQVGRTAGFAEARGDFGVVVFSRLPHKLHVLLCGDDVQMAQKMGIPTLIQEQNSYAGVTNKLLAKRADAICTAYDGMERFFPADRITLTGNPVRQNLIETTLSREEAIERFGLDPAKKTILLVGGSLGARTINESVLQHLDMVRESGVQFIWQTGKYYSDSIVQRLNGEEPMPMLHVTDFISDMGAAYKAADLVISRAGASSISEFCLIGKPVILVPSPNVAEDHQTHNAMALVNHNAAIFVKDAEAPEILLQRAIETVKDQDKLASLHDNILTLGVENSADTIADEVIKLATRQ